MTDSDYPNPAAQELDEYLESLREEPPQPGSELVKRIVGKARWQRAVRAPLRAVGSLVGALAEGLTVLIGAGEGRRR